MSNNPIQSRVADWISSSNPHPITLTWTRTSSLPVATITQTDYITSTIVASESVPTSTLSDIPYDAYAEDLWEERIHRFLPVILAFAIIGVLTVLGSLVYLAYRFYQANRASRQRRLQKAEQQDEEGNSSEKQISPLSTTLSHIIPWLGIQSPNESCYHPQQREPIRFEKSDLRRIIHDTPSTRRPSLAASWLAKLLPTRRHMSLPILLNSSSGSSGNPMDNLNVPISSTFVPIQTSSLTLVPRSEIWQDPHRRRGVDEVDMWERKQSGTEILTIAVPEEEGVQILQSQSTPQQPMWKFTQHQEAYPDSPDSFQERRFSLPLRRSMEEQQLESHRSSTATVLDSMTLPSTSTMNKPSTSQRKSIYIEKDGQNGSANASTSTNHYPNTHNYREEIAGDLHFSKCAITVKLPNKKSTRSSPSPNNDVALARQELEASRLKNSSSQWLRSSSSKSF